MHFQPSCNVIHADTSTLAWPVCAGQRPELPADRVVQLAICRGPGERHFDCAVIGGSACPQCGPVEPGSTVFKFDSWHEAKVRQITRTTHAHADAEHGGSQRVAAVRGGRSPGLEYEAAELRHCSVSAGQAWCVYSRTHCLATVRLRCAVGSAQWRRPCDGSCRECLLSGWPVASVWRACCSHTCVPLLADAAAGPSHPQAPQTPELASRSSRMLRNDADDDADGPSLVRNAPAPCTDSV